MPPKKKAPGVNLLAVGKPPPKAKKPPPPPACFKPDEIARFKEVFKLYDKLDVDRVKTTDIGEMLRFIGFNPKQAEIDEVLKKFLEDEFVDMVQLHEWYFMIEAKKNMGDDVEREVTLAMGFLGHDNEEKPTEIIKLDTLFEELRNWGEPLTDAELADWPKVAQKDKTYVFETGDLEYVKFIDHMNAKDTKFLPEPINFFKLDQRQLAAMAMEKAAEEREVIKRREAERIVREEAKRQRMIDQGLLQPEEALKPIVSKLKEAPDPFELLSKGI